MSKAFTREDDDRPERPARLRRASALPPGTQNLMTAAGVLRLRQTLERLVGERATMAPPASEMDGQSQLQSLDERILQLQQSLETAVVPARSTPDGVVAFGCTVCVRERDGQQPSYRIVGVDEVDLDRGWISWQSPLARALEGARAGQRIRFPSPAGVQELQVLSVERDD